MFSFSSFKSFFFAKFSLLADFFFSISKDFLGTYSKGQSWSPKSQNWLWSSLTTPSFYFVTFWIAIAFWFLNIFLLCLWRLTMDRNQVGPEILTTHTQRRWNGAALRLKMDNFQTLLKNPDQHFWILKFIPSVVKFQFDTRMDSYLQFWESIW